MTRQSKLIILVAYLLILSVVMLMYRTNRARKVKLLRSEIARVEAENEKMRKGEAELARLSKKIPAEANSTSLVELLYRFAKDSGLKQHDVATDAANKQSSARPGGALKDNMSVVSSRVKVNVAGSFRQIAEYVRLVQNMERFNRITEYRLTPGESGVIGSLTIETFSLPVKP